MKGSTGTPQQVVRIYSHSRRAVESRMKPLKDRLRFNAPSVQRLDGIAKHKGMSPVEKSIYVRTVQQKEQRINDLSTNIETEVYYTLVDRTRPVCHRLLSRRKARVLNHANSIYKTGMCWVMGRQELKK